MAFRCKDRREKGGVHSGAGGTAQRGRRMRGGGDEAEGQVQGKAAFKAHDLPFGQMQPVGADAGSELRIPCHKKGNVAVAGG